MSAPSARGLFAATGNQAKPKKVRLADGSYGKADKAVRDEHDFSPTPPEPIRSLLHYESDRLAEFPLIWEAACGDGRMMREIKAAGHKCVGSDLIDRGCGAIIQNFLTIKQALAKCLVTNPPFHLCNFRDGKAAWLWHALEVLALDYMALLLPWSWPGAGGLAKLWKAYPPARVYLMRWKIDFTGEGAPPMLNGWFIWDRAFKGETLLRMMDRVDSRQQVML